MAREISPGIHLLDLGLRRPLRSFAFLVQDDDALTLVDSGLPVNYPRIRSEIRATGREVVEIDRVLLTHYDLDHVGGLARLVPDLDAPAYMGRTDLALLHGNHHPPVVHHKGLFHRGLRRVHSLPDDLEIHPLDDRDRVGGFEAFHTPGHNPGHTAFVHEELGAAFLGDLVWAEDGRLTTPILFDSYDMGEISRSVRRLAAEAPPFEIVCVSHGWPILENGDDALRALADRLEEGVA